MVISMCFFLEQRLSILFRLGSHASEQERREDPLMRVLTSDSPRVLAVASLLSAPALGHPHELADRSG